MTDHNHIPWGACPYVRHTPPRTVERTRRGVDRTWVTWMVDDLTRSLRADLGMPTRRAERAINRRAS